MPLDATTFTGSYTLTQADVDAGTFTNTATVTGTPPFGDDVSDPDDDTQALEQTPAMTLEKTASPDSFGGAGETITYTITATNTGNVTLTNVRIIDKMERGSLDSLTCRPAQPVAELPPGEAVVCTGIYTTTQADVAAGSVTNTARAVSDQIGGVTAEATVKGAGSAGLPTDMLSPATDTSAGLAQTEDQRVAWFLWLLLATGLILSAGWLVRGERHRRVR